MIKTTALAAGAVLVLAACGGGDDDTTADSTGDQLVVDDSASADGAGGGELVITDGGSTEVSTDAAASDGDTVSVAAGSTSEDEQALAFASCMRDEGVDWPDPTFNADGSIDLLGGLGPGGGGGNGAGQLFSDQDSLEDAFEVCGPIVEGASFLPDQSEFLNEETQDQLLEFAQCLRDQGLDVDDPDLSALGPGGGGPAALFGEGFDPADPAVQAAIGECQGLFVGGPLGGGGN